MSDPLPPTSLFIVGPTASGKSALALRLAQQLGGEIVNADAFQLYAGLDLLTAKPTASDLAHLPHHLYSCLPLSETCDAQRYHDLALPVLQDIAARGRTPIIVGGSGLYLKALTHGIDPLPTADPALRQHLATRPLTEKVAHLLQLDPAAATTVPLRNPRYVDRALEICLLTGQPQSTLRNSFQRTHPTPIRGLCLTLPRDLLYARINARVLHMLDAGALDEVRAASALSPTAVKAIGYRELRAHLDGTLPLPDAISAIQQATRRFAKRQMTWFRRETCFQTVCLPPDATPDSLAAILRTLPHA